MSSVESTYSYGSQTFNVPERGEILIEDCPASIGDQLRRASFTQKTPGTFTKRQRALDSDREYEVVTATIDGDTLRVEASDIIGIITLTPSAKVQIDPKIAWEHIFDMLLAVYDQNRSVEYHGIPLTDFLSHDIDLKDVFVILAINYLDGLETIHRHGFIRDLVIHRVDEMDGRGEIDIERTLLNHVEGRIEPHWIRNEVKYDNPANSLLHYAGTALLRLFQQHSAEYDHRAYDRIFSEVHREIHRLERREVDSSLDRVDEYRSFTLADLPKQRHYYRKALDISKAILSSSLGKQLKDGPRELVIDYVLNMESLFEQYSQVVIERQLERIKSYDSLDTTANVTPVRSPSVKPFADENRIYHQPDHAVQEGEQTMAILDSKYYADGHNPLTDSDARSRLFSYAYLLNTNHLGFLCPLQIPERKTVAQTGAELSVITPDEGFSLTSYDGVVHDYLYDVLVCDYPTLEVFRAVHENELCLDQAHVGDLEQIGTVSGPFGFTDVKNFSLRVIKAAADGLSREVPDRFELEQGGDWTREQVETKCSQRDEDETTCVPVFYLDEGNERIDLYFVNNGDTVSVEKEERMKLL